MLGELELENLLGGNRRSDMSSRDANLAFPALHARGHSSPNDYGKLSSASSSNDIDELTSRYV